LRQLLEAVHVPAGEIPAVDARAAPLRTKLAGKRTPGTASATPGTTSVSTEPPSRTTGARSSSNDRPETSACRPTCCCTSATRSTRWTGWRQQAYDILTGLGHSDAEQAMARLWETAPQSA
jgi:hypothetical protein